MKRLNIAVCGLMFAALGAAAFRLNMAKGRGFGILAVWMAAVLAAACLVMGLFPQWLLDVIGKAVGL